MCELAISTNAIRLLQLEAPEPLAPPCAVTAELLTMLLLDGTAADRWLARKDVDVDEARQAISRLLVNTRRLVDTLTSGRPDARRTAPVVPMRTASRTDRHFQIAVETV